MRTCPIYYIVGKRGIFSTALSRLGGKLRFYCQTASAGSTDNCLYIYSRNSGNFFRGSGRQKQLLSYIDVGKTRNHCQS